MCSGFGKQRNWANPFAGKQYPSSSSSSHLLVGWFPICHMYVYYPSSQFHPTRSQQTDHHPLSWLLWGCARWWFCCAEHGLWWVTATGQNQRHKLLLSHFTPHQLSPWELNYSHRHSVAKLRKYVWLRTFPGTSEWNCGQITILLFVTVKGVWRSSLVSPSPVPVELYFQCSTNSGLSPIHLHICCTALPVNNESMQAVLAVTVTDVLGKGSLPSDTTRIMSSLWSAICFDAHALQYFTGSGQSIAMLWHGISPPSLKKDSFWSFSFRLVTATELIDSIPIWPGRRRRHWQVSG